MSSPILRAKPEHPAIRLPVASRDEEAYKLGNLPISYRGAIAGSPLTKPWRLHELSPHTLIMGATGSGKTVAMKLHMWSVLRPVEEEGSIGGSPFAMNYRALVYDAKTDLIPFFSRMGFIPEVHVILSNPFDKRSAAWDIARDVSNSADSQAFANIVVQDQSGGDEFWQISARETLSAAIDGLNAPVHADGKRRHWDLRHLVTILDRPALLEQVLVRTAKGRGILRDYIRTVDRLAMSMRATLRANLTPYRLIAALWDRAEYSFSLKRWSQGGGVLLIGDHYKYKDSMVRVNNMLVRYAIDTLMDRHDQDLDHDLTWLYLDELKNAGRFPNFGTMLTQGRSKGIRSVLAAQGLSTLKATFDEAEVEEVLNNCGEKAIMQLGTAEDAEWAERLFSLHTVTKVSRTVPHQKPAEGSQTFHDDREPRVQARELLELESASDSGGGLHAFYHWRGRDGSSNNQLSSEFVDLGMPPRILGGRPPREFIPRDPDEYNLRAFGPDDYSHLGLTRPDDDEEEGPEAGNISPFGPPPPGEMRLKLPPDHD